MINKIFKNKKNRLIIFGIGILLILVLILYFLFFRDTISITFNKKYEEIEYGTKVELKDLIESKNPENMKIKYPNIESLTEVGNYHLSFQYDVDGKKGSESFEFKIKDTKIPHFKLKINNKEVEVLVNSAYNPLSNIKEIDNFSEESLKNQVKVTKEEYTKIKKEIKSTKNKLNERVITKTKDIKSYDTFRNGIMYYTDLDLSKEGVYKVTALAVDENYNPTEKSWEIKVVPEGSIVNSGGSVVCNYTGEDASNSDAYITKVTEKYIYDEHKLVSNYELITSMIFNEDYQIADNINKLVQALDKKYIGLKDNKGVTIVIEKDSSTVTVRISVDFDNYDMEKDPLNILVEKDGSKIKIQQIIDDSKKNGFTCSIQ